MKLCTSIYFIYFAILSKHFIIAEEDPWTEETALILATKLRYLWKHAIEIFKDFDLKSNPEATSFDYVYDPKAILSTIDCNDCEDLVDGEKRQKDLSFTERKTLRLIFHDCMPYEDGSGGCDGCLNLDENEKGNLGLQHSVAVLVRLRTPASQQRVRALKIAEFYFFFQILLGKAL